LGQQERGDHKKPVKSDGSRYRPAALRSVSGPRVILQFEQRGLHGAREGFLLLAPKLQDVAPEIALAVELEVFEGGS
jgi:hypothetical protein